jgi:hypothetical protein
MRQNLSHLLRYFLKQSGFHTLNPSNSLREMVSVKIIICLYFFQKYKNTKIQINKYTHTKIQKYKNTKINTKIQKYSTCRLSTHVCVHICCTCRLYPHVIHSTCVSYLNNERGVMFSIYMWPHIYLFIMRPCDFRWS